MSELHNLETEFERDMRLVMDALASMTIEDIRKLVADMEAIAYIDAIPPH